MSLEALMAVKERPAAAENIAAMQYLTRANLIGRQPDATMAGGFVPNPRKTTPSGERSRTPPIKATTEINMIDVGKERIDQFVSAVSQSGLAPPGVGWIE